MHTQIINGVSVYSLSEREIELIDAAVKPVVSRYDSVGNPDFLRMAGHIAVRELPEGLLAFVSGFRQTEPAAAMMVKGLPISGSSIGPTPTHWKAAAQPPTTQREEFYFALLASLLGDAFGWSTLQDGHLVHDVVPVRGEENEQSGHGSVNLEWHTEDGFHPYRCDYLGLMGLRNPDRVPTTFASVRMLDLDEPTSSICGQARFLIRPDNEHVRHARELAELGHPAARSMLALQDSPEPVQVLFGNASQPYLRIDPYFMSTLPGDTQAAEALDALISALDSHIKDIVLEPGDVLFIDNYQAVHGRRPFSPRFDGDDRWLKKILVTRDLRKSSDLREQANSRVLV